MRDLRYAFRLVRRQPMFAALVIATLTLGIGASTGMFAVVNGVLLRPLPYSDPARLIWMYGSFRGGNSASVSPPDFVDYRNRNEVFERLGAMEISPASVTVAGSEAPIRLRAATVSAELISTLGTAPALGRDFSRADETTASDAIIVSHRLWQERFHDAADAVGRSIVVEGRPTPSRASRRQASRFPTTASSALPNPSISICRSRSMIPAGRSGASTICG
jgi:hypothetical protein